MWGQAQKIFCYPLQKEHRSWILWPRILFFEENESRNKVEAGMRSQEALSWESSQLLIVFYQIKWFWICRKFSSLFELSQDSTTKLTVCSIKMHCTITSSLCNSRGTRGGHFTFLASISFCQGRSQSSGFQSSQLKLHLSFNGQHFFQVLDYQLSW